jgi:molybdopterin converting factor small subunit
MLRLVFLGKFGPLAPSALDAAEPPAAVSTLGDLQAWVMEQAPALASAMAATPCRLIVNHVVAQDMTAHLRPGDEIAFMPPMSGG